MNEAPYTPPPDADTDTPLFQLASQPLALWAQTLAAMQSESLRFIADRAAKSLAAQQRIATCATPAEALGVGAEFAFEAARDCVCESQRMFALAAGDFESTAAALI